MGLTLCTVSVGLAAWVLRPQPHVPRRTVDLPALEQRLRTVRSLAAPPPAIPPVSAPDPALLPRSTVGPHELSDTWKGLREEVDLALFQRIPQPRDGATRQAVGSYRQRVRERRRYLAVLELELVDTIQNEPDAYARLDAEVRLAEVYEAQAEVFDQTWIPDSWSDARARRRLDRLETRAAVARDKAQLVRGIAQTEAAGLQGMAEDDPLAYRLADLLRDGGRSGG